MRVLLIIMLVSRSVSRKLKQRDVIEIGVYGTMSVIASILVLWDEQFWAGFCVGTLVTMVCVNLMAFRLRRTTQ